MKTKLIATLLIIALVLSLTSLSAIAASTQDNQEVTEEEHPDNYLGAIYEDEGFMRSYNDDIIQDSPGTRAKTQLFSMSIGTIYDLLTSYASGKNFTRGDLSNDYLTVSGKLKHSSGAQIKNGACYLSSGIFIAHAYTHFYSNEENSESYPYTQFGGSTTYYGFIKNDSGISGSYVTGGPLYFYNGR